MAAWPSRKVHRRMTDHNLLGNDILTKKETAARLRKSARTIDLWRKNGLPSIRFARSVFFRWSSVLAFLQKYERGN